MADFQPWVIKSGTESMIADVAQMKADGTLSVEALAGQLSIALRYIADLTDELEKFKASMREIDGGKF